MNDRLSELGSKALAAALVVGGLVCVLLGYLGVRDQTHIELHGAVGTGWYRHRRNPHVGTLTKESRRSRAKHATRQDSVGSSDASRRGLKYLRDQLERGRLARPVLTDDSHCFARVDAEVDVTQSPELLDVVALNDLTTTREIDRLAGKISRFAGKDLAQGGIARGRAAPG